MPRRIATVPEAFAGWPDWFEWYELSDPDTGHTLAVAGLDWASIPGGVGLHLEILPGRWGKRALRACGLALDWLQAEARARGRTSIVGSTTNVADARRWFRFAALYGFTDPTHMLFTFLRLDRAQATNPQPEEVS